MRSEETLAGLACSTPVRCPLLDRGGRRPARPGRRTAHRPRRPWPRRQPGLSASGPAGRRRPHRPPRQVRRLEACLSEALGEQVWRESGIGGPEGTEQLKARIAALEQQVIDLELKVQDRDDDLAAARVANRELMASSTVTPTDQAAP